MKEFRSAGRALLFMIFFFFFLRFSPRTEGHQDREREQKRSNLECVSISEAKGWVRLAVIGNKNSFYLRNLQRPWQRLRFLSQGLLARPTSTFPLPMRQRPDEWSGSLSVVCRLIRHPIFRRVG